MVDYICASNITTSLTGNETSTFWWQSSPCGSQSKDVTKYVPAPVITNLKTLKYAIAIPSDILATIKAALGGLPSPSVPTPPGGTATTPEQPVINLQSKLKDLANATGLDAIGRFFALFGDLNVLKGMWLVIVAGVLILVGLKLLT